MYKTFQTSFLRGQISLKSNNPCYQLWGEKLKPDLGEQNEKVRKISQRERRDFNGCNLGGTHFYTDLYTLPASTCSQTYTFYRPSF